MAKSLGSLVSKALFDANTILAADSDDVPAALTVGEQALVGRITSGVLAALTAAQVRTLINVADGSESNPALMSQAEAEAGTDANERVTSALRQAQAIAALASGSTPGWELIGSGWQSSGTSLTVTVPANTLAVDGDQLVVETIIHETGASFSVVANFKWDGVQFITLSVSSGDDTVSTYIIQRTGATSQQIYRAGLFGTTTFGTDAATLSGSVDVVVDLNGGSGTLHVEGLKVWKRVNP